MDRIDIARARATTRLWAEKLFIQSVWERSPFERDAAGVIPAAYCGVAVHVSGQSQDYSNATLEQFRVHLESCFGVDLAQHPFIEQECDCDAGFFEPDCILKGCRHMREEQPAQFLGLGAA